MKKVCILVCILGLLATGSTALAGSKDAVGAVIMYHILKSMVSNSNGGEIQEIVTQQGNFEFTTAEWGSPIDIWKNKMTNTQKCYQVMIIDKLIDPDTNIYYQHGIRDGDWIIAYGHMNNTTSQRWRARKCGASIEAQKYDLRHGIDLLIEGHEWYVKILRVIDYKDDVPNRINIKNYILIAD